MSKKNNEKELHWKKIQYSKIEEQIKGLLLKQPMRFNELLKELPGTSPTTINKHLKQLEAKNEVEKYFDKTKKADCYRIVLESKKPVETQIASTKAIQFVESISKLMCGFPVYVHESKGQVAMAVFSTAPENERVQWEQVYKKQISEQLPIWKEAMDALPDVKRKLAMVIMVDTTNESREKLESLDDMNGY